MTIKYFHLWYSRNGIDKDELSDKAGKYSNCSSLVNLNKKKGINFDDNYNRDEGINNRNNTENQEIQCVMIELAKINEEKKVIILFLLLRDIL